MGDRLINVIVIFITIIIVIVLVCFIPIEFMLYSIAYVIFDIDFSELMVIRFVDDLIEGNIW